MSNTRTLRRGSRRYIAHTCASLTAISLSTVHAAERNDAPSIEPVQVTASRLPEPPPISLTVIDAPAIELQHSVDVLDLLRVTPGISATQPGGPGGITEVFLRSAESNFTVVLIDGVRVMDPSNPRGGGYDFSTLNTDEIERVEIARGALSAVHGSDAMAGVINIVTKRPSAEPTATVRAEGGSDNFERASARLSGPLSEDVRGSLKASYVDFGESVEGNSQRLASVQADVDFGSVHSGIGSVRGGMRYAERDRRAFADASGGPMFAVLRDTEFSHAEEASAWAHATRALTPEWSMDVSTSYFSRREETDTPAIASGVFDGVPATLSDSRFRRGQVIVNHRYEASPKLQIGGGLDVQLEDGKRDGEVDMGFATLPSNFDLDRVIRALFTEARYDFQNGFELFGAARVDDSSEDTVRASGRLAASYRFANAGTLLHASWSNGHKQPSFYALGDTLVGNADLNVETSETWELGIEQPLADGRLTAALTAFRSRYEDLIDFDFATFKLVNRSRADIDGIEAALTAHMTETLTARLHGTFSEIDLGEAETTLLYRSESYGGLQLAWAPAGRWSLHGQLQYVGEREGSSVPTGPLTLESYERVDLAMSYEMSALATVFIAADNVFDEDFEEAVGFPSAGRQFRLGATVTF